jgi:hypothetical protein
MTAALASCGCMGSSEAIGRWGDGASGALGRPEALPALARFEAEALPYLNDIYRTASRLVVTPRAPKTSRRKFSFRHGDRSIDSRRERIAGPGCSRSFFIASITADANGSG